MNSLQNKIDVLAPSSVPTTIVVTSDVTEAVRITGDRNVHLDLGGHTWTPPEGEHAVFIDGGSVRISNGRIITNKGACVRMGAPNSTFHSNVKLDADLDLDSTEYPAVFISRGGNLVTSANMFAHNGNGEGTGCIQGNGTDSQWFNSATINGGSLISEGTAIYWPQVGTLNINGGTISGVTGVEVRAGALKVTGGTIMGTASPTSVTPNGNGSTSLGAGIAIAQHTTAQELSAIITGGSVMGFSAVYESNPEGNADAASTVSMEIVGGDFQAINGGTVAVYSETQKAFVSGGTFNTPISQDLCASGFEVSDKGDGSFGVVLDSWGSQAVGLGVGFVGMQRLVMRNKSLKYIPGGVPIPDPSFNPLCVLSATAKGGIDAWYDPANRKIVLYRNGSEISGEVEEVTIILIG